MISLLQLVYLAFTCVYEEEMQASSDMDAKNILLYNVNKLITKSWIPTSSNVIPGFGWVCMLVHAAACATTFAL